MKKLIFAACLYALCRNVSAVERTAGLSVARSDLPIARAVLSWTPVEAWSGQSVDVQRCLNDGEWETVASVSSGAATYTDMEELRYGVPYCYRLACGEDNSELAVYRRVRRIGQRGDTTLEKGVSLVWNTDPAAYGPAENSFDGNTGTFTEFNDASHRIGLDFGDGNLAYVAHARLYPRVSSNLYDYRLDGMNVYGDNSGYTGEGTALSTQLSIARGTPDQWHEMECDATFGYRYVFFYSSTRPTVNMSEIEIYGWTDADLEEEEETTSAGLAVAAETTTGADAVLTWDEESATVVYRALSESGPWTVLATGADQRRYVDRNLNYGFEYFYRVGAPEGEMSEIVSFHRLYQLERVGAATLAPGVQLLSATGLNYPDQPQTGAVGAFDGDVNTSPDVMEPARIGVRFPGAVHVALARVHARNYDSDWAYQRINGIRIYGSNDDGNWAGSATAVSEALSCEREGFIRWYQLPCDDTAGYRTLFVANPTAQSYGNWAEIEFFGWCGESDAAPSAPSVVRRADGTVAMSWTCRNAPDRYVVQRMAAGGSEWSDLGETADTAFSDATGAFGATYAYRVVAVYDDESVSSASESAFFTFYIPGDGTGLTGVYRSNYSYYDYIGAYGAAQTRTDAVLDFEWGTGVLIGDDADNVCVEWTGSLIVPVTGEYNMTMTADDAAWLFIDGQLVDSASGETHTAAVGMLEAGEHDLRVRYVEGALAATFRLRWSGAVADEVIPSSQFKPGTPASDTLPGLWEGARTFGQSRYGGYVEVDADGAGATFHDSGEALLGDQRGYIYLYRPISGDFDISFKYDRTGCFDASYQNVLLMVRAGLSNASAFRSLTVRYGTTSGRINIKYQTAGGNVALLQEGWPTQKAEYMTSGYLRIQREGRVFKAMIRPAKNSQWETFDVWTDVNREFGREVWIGPGFAMGDTALTHRTGYTARVTEIKVSRPAFMMVIR